MTSKSATGYPICLRHCAERGVLRRNPRFFRPPKLSPVEQLYTVSSQLTIRGNVAVQRLSGYPKLLA